MASEARQGGRQAALCTHSPAVPQALQPLRLTCATHGLSSTAPSFVQTGWERAGHATPRGAPPSGRLAARLHALAHWVASATPQRPRSCAPAHCIAQQDQRL